MSTFEKVFFGGIVILFGIEMVILMTQMLFFSMGW